MSAPAAALLVAACVLVAVLLGQDGGARRLRALTGHRGDRPRAPTLWVRARRRRRHRHDPALEVATVAAELSVLLRSGMPAPLAWAQLPVARVDAVGAAVQAVAAAAAQGGDVPGALRRAAAATPTVSVRAAVCGLAATWHVAQRTGAPTADVLHRYARALRADVDADGAREAALAAPRATGRLLAGLPPAGLLLGAAVGADPVGVLVGTPAGRVSALVGAAATLTGWWWTRRLLAAARSC